MTEDKEAIARWMNFPQPGAKPIECPYCHHRYVRPCNEEQHVGCMNFKQAQKHEPSP